MSTLGERLRQIRTEKGLSLDTVEDQTGISASLLSKYELGKRTPSKDRLEFLANYYNVSIDWLLGRSDSRDMVDTIMASEPVQEYLADRQSQVLQDIFRDLPDVPQEDLPLVANLVKRLAAHGGEIKDKQAVMRYVARKRREAKTKREGRPDATE